MDSKRETVRLLKRLRLLIQLSEKTQQEIESQAGFSSGYLSQMLNGHIEVKIRHLLVILDSIEIRPAELFLQLFPRRRNRISDVLETFKRRSGSFDKSLVRELARLYGYGIESLDDLEDRLDRCEHVLTELDVWNESKKDPIGMSRANSDLSNYDSDLDLLNQKG